MRVWRCCAGMAGMYALPSAVDCASVCMSVCSRHMLISRQNKKAGDDFSKQLRHALIARLCCPQHPLPRLSIYQELANTTRIVTEFHHVRTSRRLHKQQDALCFLRRQNVLMYSLLYYAQQSRTWNVTSEFGRLALFGEAVLRAEVHARLLQLFPTISSDFYAQCIVQMLHEDALATLFDELNMTAIVGARPPPRRRSRPTGTQELKTNGESASKEANDRQTCWVDLSIHERATIMTNRQKSNMLCAIVGEMQWFVDRTKSVDRTHNNALFPPSDVLVLHVLCSHLLECVPAEVIYRVVEPQVNAIRAVWVNEPMSVPAQLHLKPRTPNAMSLCITPRPAPSSSDNVLVSPTTTSPENSMPADVVTRKVEAKHITSLAANARTESSSTNHRTFLPELMPLTAERNTNYVKSVMRPLCNHKHFDGSTYCVFAHEVRAAIRTPLLVQCSISECVEDDTVPCAFPTHVSHCSDDRARELIEMST